jgi:putative transposase
VIPKSIQLIAGRVGQEYNLRKKRKGAYWEDRYHATAVQADNHLMQCMVYIDLNMVRAGVVTHPADWPYGGYAEIQSPRKRYALIDYDGLKNILNFKTMGQLAVDYRGSVEVALTSHGNQRDRRWTESIAVGSEQFVQSTKERLGVKARGREVIAADGSSELQEEGTSYKTLWATKSDFKA